MKRADDKLRDIFLEIRTDQPSAGFESKLMQQIQTVAAKENKKNHDSEQYITLVLS